MSWVATLDRESPRDKNCQRPPRRAKPPGEEGVAVKRAINIGHFRRVAGHQRHQRDAELEPVQIVEVGCDDGTIIPSRRIDLRSASRSFACRCEPVILKNGKKRDVRLLLRQS